ncbi:hypothetical protein FF38_10843, partial [Lucilia cuprina]
MLTRGSIGTVPKWGTPANLASSTPPSEENIFVQLAQWGHTKPLIFSTIPKICMPVFLQKVISLRTSSKATPCGVVTIMAPSQRTSRKHSITVICSSEVPGVFLGPRQMTGSLRDFSRNPIDITANVLESSV